MSERIEVWDGLVEYQVKGTRPEAVAWRMPVYEASDEFDRLHAKHFQAEEGMAATAWQSFLADAKAALVAFGAPDHLTPSEVRQVVMQSWDWVKKKALAESAAFESWRKSLSSTDSTPPDGTLKP